MSLSDHERRGRRLASIIFAAITALTLVIIYVIGLDFPAGGSSSGGGSHPSALTEPSVKLSPHWALIRRTSRFSRVASVQRSPGTRQPVA